MHVKTVIHLEEKDLDLINRTVGLGIKDCYDARDKVNDPSARISAENTFRDQVLLLFEQHVQKAFELGRESAK